MKKPSQQRLTALSAAIVMFLAAGCGGGSAANTGSGSGPEKKQIKVGILPIIDVTPVKIAQQQGLFKAEGLEVKEEILGGGAEAIPKLMSGDLQFSFGNYISYMVAQQKTGNLKLVVEGYESDKNTHLIVAPKNSPISKPADLKGKKIAVNAKRNISTLLTRRAAESQNVTLDEDKNFAEVPFPNMGQAMKSGDVDAALVGEPFATILQSQGLKVVWDTSQESTKNFPLAGYAASAKFVDENPKTAAAFQRAMYKAAEIAGNRDETTKILQQDKKMEKLADSVSIGKFPTTMSPTRMQRVADTMLDMGFIEEKLDVKPMLFNAE